MKRPDYASPFTPEARAAIMAYNREMRGEVQTPEPPPALAVAVEVAPATLVERVAERYPELGRYAQLAQIGRGMTWDSKAQRCANCNGLIVIEIQGEQAAAQAAEGKQGQGGETR